MLDTAVTSAPESAPSAPAVETPAVVVPAAAPEQDFDAFHEEESGRQRGKSPSPKEAPAPSDKTPAVEAKPKAEPAPDPAPGKREPSPLVENLRKTAEENRQLKARLAKLETPPSPPAAPATAKPEAAAPVDDPEPDIEKYEAPDLGKYFKDLNAWNKRETQRQVASALKTRDMSAAETAAKDADAKRHTELAGTQQKLDAELKDWTTTVIGTQEAPGLIAVMDPEVVSWASSNGEVAFRGLYALANASAAEQERILSLPLYRQAAEIEMLGEGKKAAEVPTAPVPTGRPKVPNPPTKQVSGAAGPLADPEDTDDFDSFHAHQLAKIAASGRRR